MKNKVLLCGWIIVIMALSVAFGYTNARYYSVASMTGDLDYVKTIGKISIYNPTWVGGYDSKSESFKVQYVGAEFPHIHYEVTNNANDEINAEVLEYYIRIVGADGSSDIPIEYDVHTYKENEDTPVTIFNFEEGVGYGPFTLKTQEAETTLYSIRARWTSEAPEYLGGVQQLRVQMVKKRKDGETLKVIDEAPFNIKYSGKASLALNYYLHEDPPSESPKPLGQQSLEIGNGISIDFNNDEQLRELGIQLPEGCTFHDVRKINDTTCDEATVVAIPAQYNGESDYPKYSIDVYLNSTNSGATVNLYYYNTEVSGQPFATQILSNVSVGTTIDFNDPGSLSGVGIALPNGCEFMGAYCDELSGAGAVQDAFTIPEDGADKTYNIRVVTSIRVPVRFYNKDGIEVSSTTVDMKSDGTYDFTTDVCRTLCPELQTMTSFTVYIANQWGSTYDNVGNTSEMSSVIVDYNKTYTSWADFKLTDEGSYIYIKAWW